MPQDKHEYMGRSDPYKDQNVSTEADKLPSKSKNICSCSSPNRRAPHQKDGFLSPDGGSWVWDCMLIRRSAKMLAENLDCAWPVSKKIWLSEKQLLNLRCHRITMVQATESRKGLNLPFTRRANGISVCRPAGVSFASPRCVLVTIEQVGRHQPFEMPLIRDNHVVQQVPSATSYPTLRNTVLPRTAKGRSSWLASHVPHSRNHLGCKLCVAVE